MSMVFKFRLLSDEDENFIRDYELLYDSTLTDFHNLICEDIGYDEQEMASFFLSDGSWAKLREFTLFDMGMSESEMQDEFAPVAMDNVTLGQIIHHNNERLLYVFDLMEDRAFFVELIEAKKAEDGRQYPNVVFANGVAPDQFDAENVKASRSIFDEAMDDFGEFDGDDSYDDEY